MKHLSILLFSILIASCVTTGDPRPGPVSLTDGDPGTVGMSGERLERIDKMILKAIESGEIPGAVALVARHGKIVYYNAFGTADVSTGREFARDDIFRIASQTKAITSTAVMMLWEEGLFRLDDPISRYIPEFSKTGVLDTFNEADSSFTIRPPETPVTVRHLLTHTSGIGYGMIDPDDRFRKIYARAGIIDAFTTKPVTIEENIKKLAGLPLHHNPGAKFTYSEGLDVLGYFIELMSGMPLDRFFQEKIFEPLGMNDTYFYLPESKYERLVPVQTKENGELKVLGITGEYDPDYPVKGARTFFAGGAGLSSTAKDYATFLQMYLNKGELNGHRLLSRTTVEFMMANQVGDLFWDNGEYFGLAFSVLNQKGEDMGGRGSKGTFQWGGYFNTQYFADPEEELIGIIMKQTYRTGPDNTGWKFRLLTGQAIDD